jgi:hypothetical protein
VDSAPCAATQPRVDGLRLSQPGSAKRILATEIGNDEIENRNSRGDRANTNRVRAGRCAG